MRSYLDIELFELGINQIDDLILELSNIKKEIAKNKRKKQD